MTLPKKMTVARMHEIGGPMVIEEIDTPEPGPGDVLVRVRSCGIVPNLANILKNWSTWFPERPLPPLPAIFGLDPAGEIVAVGPASIPGKSENACMSTRAATAAVASPAGVAST